MGLDMASTDAAFGLMPYGEVLDAHIYSIVTSNSVAVHIGDCMEAGGASYSTPAHGNLLSAAVEEGGAAGSILGACLATFDDSYDPIQYIPASTSGNSTIAGYALIADNPDQLYLVQEDGDTSSIQAASVGLNADMVSTSTPASTSGYRSTMELDSNTIASTATLAMKVVGVHPDDAISTTGSAANYCRFIVKVNTAFKGDGIVGV